MKTKTNHFEYVVPFKSELEELYITPYRFSDELRQLVDSMFLHPKHNKYHTLYSKHYAKWRSNDMLKHAYLIVRYYQQYPQRYGHSIDNIVPHAITAMWKSFLGMSKQFSKVELKKYYPASMKLLVLGKGKFLDVLLSDIDTGNIIYHSDDMIKRREGLDLRERKQSKKNKVLPWTTPDSANGLLLEGSDEFEYLCGLE